MSGRVRPAQSAAVIIGLLSAACLLLRVEPKAGVQSAGGQHGLVRHGGTYPRLPTLFEPNQGQAVQGVRFISHGPGYILYLTSDAAEFRFQDSVARLRWIGANPEPAITGEDRQGALSNYFLGNDRRNWRANVPNDAKVRYTNLYPGIDLVFYGSEGRLEYDWVVTPGADPGAIRLRWEGAGDVQFSKEGDVVLNGGGVRIRQKTPAVYQDFSGVRRDVTGRYACKGKNEVGIELASYDRSKTLVIDPVLAFSTYFGGTGTAGNPGEESFRDSPGGMVVDAAGNVYITGTTNSADFPTRNPLQASWRGFSDAFVAKFSPAGSLLYSTYLGGSGFDFGLGIAVDATGALYISGRTESQDFPTVNPFQPAPASNADAFVAKLNPSGSALLYSTYLGGSDGRTGAGSVAVDPAGNIFVAGSTSSPNLPAKTGVQLRYGGGNIDVFVAELNASGSTLVYLTYLGGSGADSEVGMTIDAAGNVYVVGNTDSTDFPATPGAFQTASGGSRIGIPWDAFFARIGAGGRTLAYATYLGSSGFDEGNGIALDSAGNVYVMGRVGASDFSVKGGQCLGGTFLTKFRAGDSAVVYSLCPPGIGMGQSVAVDSAGDLYIAGAANNIGGTVLDVVNPVQAIKDGGRCTDPGPPCFDASLVKLSGTDGRVLFATFLGGSGNDFATNVAVDGSGNAHVLGRNGSINFPTVRPIETSGHPMFLAKVDPNGTMPAPTAVTNGATFARGPLARGGAASIFGFALTDVSGIVQAEGYPLPTELAGVSVTVTGVPAPLYAVANVNGVQQINFQVPYEAPRDALTADFAIVVKNKAGTSLPVRERIRNVPGVFTVDGTNGAIQHASDFTLVSRSSPAARGEVVIIYATGLGAVDPPVPSGLPAPAAPLSRTLVNPSVTIGGAGAEVLFSGLTPGYAGLYQVNARIPENAPTGLVDVILTINASNGEVSRPVKIAVQ